MSDLGPEEGSFAEKPLPRPARSTPEQDGGRLGSLAQGARAKKLDSARNLLLAIGFLTILVNAVFLYFHRDQVKKEIAEEVAKIGAANVDPVQVKQIEEQAILITMGIDIVAIAVGVAFVVLGLSVKKFPVPVTILSLVIYILSAGVFALIDPTTLARGAIMKLIVVFLLFQAIRTAMAYEKEKQAALGYGV